jgi:IclR helix-turn-helix domain
VGIRAIHPTKYDMAHLSDSDVAIIGRMRSKMSHALSVAPRPQHNSESIGQEDQPTSTLHSAFAVIRALGRIQQHPVGVTRLAAETGIPKTTAHRLLEQLAEENIVQRHDRRWTFAPGLYELDRRRWDLASVAHPRLRSISLSTGASVFLYDATGKKLTAISRAYGSGFRGILSPSEQCLAAESPASAVSQALDTGHTAYEFGAVHPECSCIAKPFVLPSGEPGILAFGLPMSRDLESFKRPVDRVAKLIESDMHRLAS